MRFVVLVLLVAATPVMGSEDMDWYQINNVTMQCTKGGSKQTDTPADFILGAQRHNVPYEAKDVRNQAGQVIIANVRFDVPGPEKWFIYYRGKRQCELSLADKRAQQKSDVDRYK